MHSALAHLRYPRVVAPMPDAAGRLDVAVVVAAMQREPLVHECRVQFIHSAASSGEVVPRAEGRELQPLAEFDVLLQLAAPVPAEAEALQLEHEHPRRRVHLQPLRRVRQRLAVRAPELVVSVELLRGCESAQALGDCGRILELQR